ncbi:hypothetical protein QQZ08_001390 [Neonectria magnoliae]|uniref:Microbial-type PARG catalytic domain-containing protein n=1 Tax=Neonectria magnoliae TaxID=2732573 RepID=A0ABR1IFW0_9HYPO
MQSQWSSTQRHGQSRPSQSSTSNRAHRDPSQRETLKATAQETRRVLPGLLNELNTTKQASRALKYSFDSLPRLHPDLCPAYPQPATIRVLNDDTLNAAIRLSRSGQQSGQDPNADADQHALQPAVVNFANRHSPGGGWLNGALAQEEALCYRSSLALSLNRKEHYPLATSEALYSPYVLVVREDMASGHRISPAPASHLPVVSVLTVAALHRPQVEVFECKGRDGRAACSGSPPPKTRKKVFARDRDRDLTKCKMRLSLRMAAKHGHGMLVLGAFGCGVYGNPPEDVAHCWLEVLREDEFSGNWWREVWFAVYDPKDEGNFGIFAQVLEGEQV